MFKIFTRHITKAKATHDILPKAQRDEIRRNAEFFKWHENAIGVIKRFCNLCYLDPALVETYLGVSLD